MIAGALNHAEASTSANPIRPVAPREGLQRMARSAWSERPDPAQRGHAIRIVFFFVFSVALFWFLFTLRFASEEQ